MGLLCSIREVAERGRCTIPTLTPTLTLVSEKWWERKFNVPCAKIKIHWNLLGQIKYCACANIDLSNLWVPLVFHVGHASNSPWGISASKAKLFTKMPSWHTTILLKRDSDASCAMVLTKETMMLLYTTAQIWIEIISFRMLQKKDESILLLLL